MVATTINQLKDLIQSWCESHLQLNSFFWGEFHRAVEKELKYPLLVAMPIRFSTDGSGRFVRLNLSITVADKVLTDFSNLDDTHSDCLQIISDFEQAWKNDFKNIGTIDSMSGSFFIEKQADNVSGCTAEFTLKIKDFNCWNLTPKNN
jgi:hypothetical protein